MPQAESLLDQIQRDVLDDTVPLANALRKCLALGGQSGSEELRDWATLELQGYKDLEANPLPDYRVVPAALMVDRFSGNAQIQNQQISASILPDFAQEWISDRVEFRQGVGEIEALIKQGEQVGFLRLGIPMGAEIARLMNADPQQHSTIDRIYWSVTPAAVRGVVDQVRTSLTQLVAELRATMPRGEEVPSTEAANQAVQVVVHGGKRSRINVNTSQASGPESTATTTTTSSPAKSESGSWSRSKRIGAFVVGAATIAGAVFAAIQVF